MMQSSSMPESMASSPMIWMTGLVSPSRSTSGNISFWTAVEAGYWRVPRPAAVMTALRTLAMGGGAPCVCRWAVYTGSVRGALSREQNDSDRREDGGGREGG